ncbi:MULTISPECIES: tRNA (adenosine(37)-N6)-threonylcarbamoyltransferase complex dimerization subunit type 1 TsaB [unclassified Halanaerobium]|uniref:tRNA (adenosine(37)-N6)-threonylcarbamoyltransferase complex dimerization subunit type 1 TsaB n=1 Tax=unclassified Halanaerobium TaxID=2641197 RepID=UPI000DF3CAC4|nr:MULTISPECIES: tRNA (adenosine(37)-N6)-threonylcarbamoyltransferase complex dimerization subunit type 1 TsaB [unclassified Halanaerobium]RCW49247.1 tRNA threonylcarbamoyladenosine biosynthesis protein TsaB [Halanaerobium sp. MA284_MarDTE_T2]RCW83986.1 tRNA threonylcarbamoyladenosine biosynthesis protein TsaB [Halanaerobium sp. DL-01]
MLILGIDTSTEVLGLALADENKIKAEYNLRLRRQHSEKLLPLIKEMFAVLEIEPSEIEAVAVSTGPGSFTGLRIGITAAKIISRINNIPIKGVSTLEITASSVKNNGIIIPLIDAGRNRFYFSIYLREDNNLKLISDPEAAQLDIISKKAAAVGSKDIYVVGEKSKKAADILAAELDNNIIYPGREFDYPQSSILAVLGHEYIEQKREDDLYKIKPKYLKKPQAEINWLKKYGSQKSES